MKNTLTTRPAPLLRRTKATIAYTSTDGYRLEFAAKADPTSRNARTGEPVPPQESLLAAIEELSRILALFGFGQEAEDRFFRAQHAVAASLAKRAQAVQP